jgi:hypothetical protein
MLDLVLVRADVRRKVEVGNADAVWLRLWKRGEGEKVIGMGRQMGGRWGFVEV